jgi:hypothetical protein
MHTQLSRKITVIFKLRRLSAVFENNINVVSI